MPEGGREGGREGGTMSLQAKIQERCKREEDGEAAEGG